MQAFSAGLLFAQAASALGSELTRDGLIDQLKKIKHWDGGGLQAPADPGDNQGLRCFLYMQVQGNKFVRYWPKSPDNGTNGFDCAPGNSMPMTKTLRAAAGGLRMMGEFWRYTIFGLAFAGVYFIAASGLVVTYTASGIFNFAHGAVAMIAAFTYWELRIQHHWAAPLAFAAVLLVEAPIMGAGDRARRHAKSRRRGHDHEHRRHHRPAGDAARHRFGRVGAEQVRGDAVAPAVLSSATW